MINIPKPTLYLRVDKPKKDGRMPLYIRFPRIDGEEPKFSTGMTLLPEEWDDATKRPREIAQKLIVDNEVARIETRIYNAVVNGTKLTKNLLREIVVNKPIENPANASFYDYFDRYVSSRLESNRLSQSTARTYATTRRALKEFREKLRVKDINAKFLADFEKFLITRGEKKGRGNVLGSRANRLKNVRTIIYNIDRRGIPIENLYKTRDCTVPEAAVNDVFLNREEVAKFFRLFMKLKHRTKEFYVLGMYLFSCSVSVRLGDALKIKWDNMSWPDDKTTFLTFIPSKGDREGHRNKEISIPVPTFGFMVMSIIAKSDEADLCTERHLFPSYSGVTINKTLRELAQRAGINKHVTFHSARRTFASIAKADGADLSILQEFMGHQNEKMTQRYIKKDISLAIEEAEKLGIWDIKKILEERKKAIK